MATILVVDDQISMAHAFARALTLAGHSVQVAHSAEVAFQEATAHYPDAIILDFNMPFVNGVGFLYRLRAHDALGRTPVLLITGESLTDEVQAELRDLRANVMLKPVRIADLVTGTRTLLEEHAATEPAPADDDRHARGPRIQ